MKKINLNLHVFLILIFLSGCTPNNSTAPQARTKQLSQDQVDAVDLMQASGFLVIHKKKNEAHVDKMFWEKMDRETKNNFVTAWAMYIGEADFANHKVDVFDKKNRKPLAHYDISRGVIIY